MDSTSKSSFREDEWVVWISRNLDEQLEEEIEIPVSIFNVPKSLLISHPNSYVPQQIPIGPYNCFPSEHSEVERYKIAAAKRIQKRHQSLKFHHVVEQFKKHEKRIRAHYQRYLNLNCDTLAWMMLVDACFLLEFLGVFALREGTVLTRVPSRMSHFVDYAGKKSPHNGILRDIVMLENQIPLFLLRKVLEFQFSSIDLADELLTLMLVGLCKEISPFEGTNELPNAQALMTKCAHLLDFLYHTIIPKSEEPSDTVEAEDKVHEEQEEVKDSEERSFETSSNVQKILDMIWKALSNLNAGPVRVIKQLLISKPIAVISNLPWTSISNFPGTKRVKDKAKNENLMAGGNFDRPPLMEEINIPSVTELSKAGVNFAPTYAGISSITFEVKTRTLYLPVVSIDVNSEVLLRNLVAYEACNASGPLVFTRYTELMNGVIDTDEDVKVLRQKGIVENHLKTDGGVTKLWNGMSRSIRLTKVEFLDRTIADVNKYYNGRPCIKFKKFMARYVFASWKFLTLLATILMLLFTGVQGFCSVYSCPGMVTRVQSFQ